MNTVPTHQARPKKAHKYVANTEINVDSLICGQELLRLNRDFIKREGLQIISINSKQENVKETNATGIGAKSASLPLNIDQIPQ